MPLVRIRDDLQLEPDEFVILSYRKELYRETSPEGANPDCRYMMDCLERTVREKYAEILNRDKVREMVENLGKKYPALISETIPAKISYGLLTDVLKRFMARGNSCLYLVRVIEILDDTLCRKGTASAEELVAVLAAELE